MQYTVELTIRARHPLTEEALLSVAEIGGVAVGWPGKRHLETTLTVEAPDVCQAAARDIRRITERVAGDIVAVTVMTTKEADRRTDERQELVGIAEIARMLKVSKQRASALSRRGDFPAPIARLQAGPIWRAGDLSTLHIQDELAAPAWSSAEAATAERDGRRTALKVTSPGADLPHHHQRSARRRLCPLEPRGNRTAWHVRRSHLTCG